jgi:uncharacterized protein YfaS (alpha-2-macroglobulin family)
MLKDRMLLLETRQIAGLQYSRDALLRYKQEGILGEIFFSDRKPVNYWYYDELSVNAIAYRIIRRDSLLTNMLVPMQLYFLAQRKSGEWNTYHSSNVLMSVLPDLLSAGASKGHSGSVVLSGKVNRVLDIFPYQLRLQPNEEVHVHKSSGLPLYLMQYAEERVTTAKTGIEGFEISTYLGEDSMTIKAGEPTTLTVEVNVTKDASAEYVMIEVPIPGACSYADKRQLVSGIETHREYFKDRTVIFCENMQKGKYTFVIHLLPRFTGKYSLNPAQVSLMYAPVVNANTDLKTIRVE